MRKRENSLSAGLMEDTETELARLESLEMLGSLEVKILAGEGEKREF